MIAYDGDCACCEEFPGEAHDDSGPLLWVVSAVALAKLKRLVVLLAGTLSAEEQGSTAVRTVLRIVVCVSRCVTTTDACF